MDTENQIIEAIYDAIDEINKTLGPDQRLTRTPGTVLIGNGKLDSLQLLNLTLTVEGNIERIFRQSISVTEAALLGDELTPLTVTDLAGRIEKQLHAAAHA
ncbi:MAG: hypothetical protein IPM66_02515 [Acidobacteriota bacterium]|nr:MAG: hypothetical protein IPM66_02515 [Acidobacteriota bacterium]